MIKYILFSALVGLAAAGTSSICPSEGTRKLAIPRLTTRYVTCIDGIPSVSTCESGTQFDASYEQCVVISTVEKAADVEIVCPETDTPEEPIYVAHPGRCYVYFICVNNVPHEQICPDGTYFNPAVNTCDLPEKVDCES
ncbi:peritrophin-1-like [Wyeomyia smithii]|uniref:peritrophin-1-like n=1 Tax=Wyeomyia smithii TaxID=174621 RepID=UPI002467B4A9|nr:peritrophin-1-like [Wyeomyia smithii]